VYIFVLIFILIFSPKVSAAVDASSELRRFDDEDLQRQMKAMLESDTEPVIQFADEDPTPTPKATKTKS